MKGCFKVGKVSIFGSKTQRISTAPQSRILEQSSPLTQLSPSTPFRHQVRKVQLLAASCRVLRRILCPLGVSQFALLITLITEVNSVAGYNKQQFNAVNKIIDASKVTPGIVTRLTALDSLPEISLLKTQVNPNSIT